MERFAGGVEAEVEAPQIADPSPPEGYWSHWQVGCDTRLLTAEEEIVLARRVREGDLEARRRMVEGNLRLVISIARRYHCRSLAFEDLVQEGVVGLIAAVTRYDPDRGYRFSTYATHWIRQAIGRAIDNQSRVIRIPSHAADLLRRLERCRLLLARRLGRQPTLDELAGDSGVPSQKIQWLLQSAQEPVSLDALLGEEEETSLSDLLLDVHAPDPEQATMRRRKREAVKNILAILPARERRIIETRFGIADGRVRSLQEVGEELHMSREGVRQIEVRALRRLKEAAFAHRIDVDAV